MGLFALVYEQAAFFGVSELKNRLVRPLNLVGQQLTLGYYIEDEAVTTITTKKTSLAKGEYPWITSYSFNGTPGYNYSEYVVTYDFLNRYPVSYELVSQQDDLIAMVPNTFVTGSKVKKGAFFYPKFSRYGVNCKTCTGEFSGHGNFSVGIGADVVKGVRQFNGKYKPGLTFEGYYIVATDSAIPLCSVLRFDNHNFKGGGLTPAVPFYAVVLDRGGAIKKNRVDFYIGDERIYNDIIKYSGKRKTKATIVYFGLRRSDASGKRSCKLPSLKDMANVDH